MTAVRTVLVHDDPGLVGLATLLAESGADRMDVVTRPMPAGSDPVTAVGTLAPCDCLVLAPVGRRAMDQVEDAADAVADSFALIQAALAAWQPDRPGRLLILLPGEAAMGDPGRPVESALAGAMLSLCRTVALEVRKRPVTINAVMYRPSSGTDDAEAARSRWAGVAAQIRTLAQPACRDVNGQEIFVTAALDVGRLHP